MLFRSLKGFSLSRLITYFMIATFVSIIVYDDVFKFLEEQIKKGDFIVYMLKPTSLIRLEFIKKFSTRAFALFVEVIPVLAIFVLFFQKYIMAGHLVFFSVSLILAFILSYLIYLLVGTLAFWLVNIRSLSWLIQFSIHLASGLLVPLDLFPGIARNILNFLPFKHIIYTPTMIYLGKYPGDALFFHLGTQAFWVGAMAVICLYVWSRAIKRFSGVGA